MKNVSIDNGYWATKIAHAGQLANVKSKYTEDPDGDFEFLGKKYTIGHGSYNIEHDKTNNELHRLTTYYALSKLTHGTEEFNLTVSLPMLHYKGGKEEFKNYIQGDGTIKTRLENKEKKFQINAVTVFMQGAGALYANNPTELKRGIVGVLDIGGLTAQGCVFENLKPIGETMFQVDAGMIILNNKIKTRLLRDHKVNVQDYEIPYLDLYQDTIKEVTQEHFQGIRLEMQKKNWSLDTIPIMCTGGGSLQMGAAGFFRKGFLSNDPVNDNVKGLQVIGGMIYATGN